MKQKYIVLHMKRLAGEGSFRSNTTQPHVAAKLPTARVELLHHRDARDLASDPELSVARATPMRLIAPRAGSSQSPESGEIAWGVEAVKAHTSPFTGAGITVAVLDTGITAHYRKHPAFAHADIIQKNFTLEVDSDLNGHGTHCAGTIFGHPISGKRIGVAPGVSRVLVGKVLGQQGGSSDQLVSAILWAAEHGAHLISMSLSIDFPGLVKQTIEEDGLPPELATSRALEEYRRSVLLFERLASLLRSRARSTLLIAASGNESRRELDPSFQIGVAPPAASDGIVSVAAVGNRAGRFFVASFSNTGASVCGPGVDIVSAGPESAPVTMSGTSMATPHVVGVAALWAERMIRSGPIDNSRLVAYLVGNASLSNMEKGTGPNDVGTGMVQAPQG